MSEVTIRALVASDIPAVVRLHRRALPRDFITSLGEPFLARVFYGSILSRPEGVGLVLESPSRLLAFVVGANPAALWYRSLLGDHRRVFALSALGRLREGPEALVELAEVSLAMLRGSRDPEGFPADLGYMAVDEAARGQGLGRKIVLRFLEALAARGASGCWTKTHATNRAARKLYESCGFRPLGRHRVRRTVSVYYGINLPAEGLS